MKENYNEKIGGKNKAKNQPTKTRQFKCNVYVKEPNKLNVTLLTKLKKTAETKIHTTGRKNTYN